MRLEREKAEFLKKLIKDFLPDAKVFLFGSRVYDNKKGGDIDILVLSNKKLNFNQRTKIEYEFFKKFGEQKLDIVSFTFNEEDPFKNIIIDEAVEI